MFVIFCFIFYLYRIESDYSSRTIIQNAESNFIKQNDTKTNIKVDKEEEITTPQKLEDNVPKNDILKTKEIPIPIEPTKSVNPIIPETFSCQGKTKCGEMVSCSEAYFYLQTCGVNRLDGDKDGIPCETLCE